MLRCFVGDVRRIRLLVFATFVMSWTYRGVVGDGGVVGWWRYCWGMERWRSGGGKICCQDSLLGVVTLWDGGQIFGWIEGWMRGNVLSRLNVGCGDVVRWWRDGGAKVKFRG